MGLRCRKAGRPEGRKAGRPGSEGRAVNRLLRSTIKVGYDPARIVRPISGGGSSLRRAHARAVAGVHAGGAGHARSRHRRQHRDLQRRQRRAAAAAAVSGTGTAGRAGAAIRRRRAAIATPAGAISSSAITSARSRRSPPAAIPPASTWRPATLPRTSARCRFRRNTSRCSAWPRPRHGLRRRSTTAAGGPLAAVLGHALWRQRFNSDPAVGRHNHLARRHRLHDRRRDAGVVHHDPARRSVHPARPGTTGPGGGYNYHVMARIRARHDDRSRQCRGRLGVDRPRRRVSR